MRAALGLVATVALALLAVGCADDENAFSQAEYQEAAAAFLDAQEQWARGIADCAAEDGIDAVVSWDFGIMPPDGLDGAALDHYWSVIDACSELFDPEIRSLTEDELRWLYGMLLAAGDCVEAEGHEVPEPQTEETFVSEYMQIMTGGRGAPWSPYDYVLEGTSEAAFQEIMTACPQPGIW